MFDDPKRRHYPISQRNASFFSRITLCSLVLWCLAGSGRIYSREGEEGREEVGRKPIWPWRMEHSDSRSTGLVTQSCIPGVEKTGMRGGGCYLYTYTNHLTFTWLVLLFNSVECKCILLLQNQPIDKARKTYERLVTQFPSSGRFWKLFIEAEVNTFSFTKYAWQGILQTWSTMGFSHKLSLQCI